MIKDEYILLRNISNSYLRILMIKPRYYYVKYFGKFKICDMEITASY